MINKVILSGRLTDKPELRYTKSDIPVASFTLAVERSFTNSYGDKDTDFVPIVAWRQLAEICQQYLRQGDKPTVIGRLQIRSYTAEDGSSRRRCEVIAEEIELPARPRIAEAGLAMPEEVKPFGAGRYNAQAAVIAQTEQPTDIDEEQQMELF